MTSRRLSPVTVVWAAMAASGCGLEWNVPSDGGAGAASTGETSTTSIGATASGVGGGGGSAASTGSSSSSGGGAGPCDNVDTCDACGACAIETACSALYATCCTPTDSVCSHIAYCMARCECAGECDAGGGCVAECQPDAAAPWAAYKDVVNCVLEECASRCEGERTPTPVCPVSVQR